ncbi:MAG: glycosyltransferase family 4 protein [Ardenticatenaceae bacterium]
MISNTQSLTKNVQKNKIKPLVLVITDGMFLGGTERQIVELLKGLKQNGRFRTVLAVLDRGGVLEAEAKAFVETVLPIRRRTRFDITLVVKLIHYAHSARVSLIHTFGWMSGLAGLLAARLLRVPIINSGVRSAPPHLSLRHRISRLAMRHADVVVANSQAGLQAYGLAQDSRAKVIHNGLELERFEGVVPASSLGPTVCMVANFSQYKDHATVIRAIAIVRQTLPDVRLTLVGREIGTLDQSRQLVNELGLATAVEFVTNTSRPQPYIAGSQVCVLASTQNEGLSNAILEYMALSKPVVATACEGNAEVIQEGKTGFLFRSPEALAKRVVELLCYPRRAQEIGQAGRERVIRKFSLELLVREYEQLYDYFL